MHCEGSGWSRLKSRMAWPDQVVALVRGEELWVANAGDSRCVCSRRGLALALSRDHKPTDDEELQRISRVTIYLTQQISTCTVCYTSKFC